MSPFTPDDPAWDALKDRLWDHYHTSGYQGERFAWEGDFYTALDQALLAICTRPIPISERLPRPHVPGNNSPQDCDPNGRCWGCVVTAFPSQGVLTRFSWVYVHHSHLTELGSGVTHWLPHWALPLPEVAE